METVKLSSLNQEEIIKKTLSVLKSGGLVVFPTDTVYGLLVDATNSSAIDKLLTFKDRPAGKAISIFVCDENMAKGYIKENPNSTNIFKSLLPGPFTIICKYRYKNSKHEIRNTKQNIRNSNVLNTSHFAAKRLENSDFGFVSNFDIRISDLNKIDPRLLAENGTLGIRLPDFPLITKLVKQYGKPLTATSANLSGTPAHYSIASFLLSFRVDTERAKRVEVGIEESLSLVDKDDERKGSLHPSTTLRAGFGRDDSMQNRSFGKKLDLIDLIVDAGNLPKNKPSTVIDTTSGELKTLRFGDLLPNTPNSLLSKSEEETKQLARFILSKSMKKSAGRPIVFLLQGELGAGKTIFTKGLGKILRIKEEIISPTYTLCYEYRINQNVGAIHESPADNSSGFSTGKHDLSTEQPIENSSGFDTKGQDLNIDYVYQILNNMKCEVRSEKLEMKHEIGSEKPDNPKIKYPTSISSFPFPTSHFLIHYDLYRIETPEDLKEIKFLESIKPENIYAIEWPERIDENTLSKLKEVAQIVYITISHVNEMTREIRWS